MPGAGRPDPDALVLAIDAGSPLVSVAVGRDGEVLAQRSIGIRRSSGPLLRLVGETLAEAGASPRHLGGLVGLRGPGSFTGLRVGLSTLLGLHQALAIPATAVPTLEVLATLAPPAAPRILAAVDALRGEWTVQAFAPGSPPRARGAPQRLPAAELAALGPACLVGFGTIALDAVAGGALDGFEPGPLAGAALRWIAAAAPEWDASTLTAPLYLRPPAVTPPVAGRAR